MKKLRILLEDGYAVQKGTGIGQYTLNLFELLRDHPWVEAVWLLKKPGWGNYTPLRRLLYIVWLNTKLQLLLRNEQVDVIHFTNYLLPFTKLSKTKYAVTIHDMTAWRFPKALPIIYRAYIKWAISHAVRNGDLIFTVSNAVRDEISRMFNISASKVQVAYNGPASQFWSAPKVLPESTEAERIRSSLGIKEEFLLFVGTLEVRKNVLTLIKAFEIARKEKKLQLVLAGRPGKGFSSLSAYIREHQLTNEIVITGYLSQQTLIALYDLALGFVYPSFYEGFGIPLVEAMVRGTPIIASKIPSTDEITGDAALYYDDPLDYIALAQQIIALTKDENLRLTLVQKGTKQAHKFSKETLRYQFIQAYLGLLEGN